LNVRLQHVPQAVEFHPAMAGTPPMKGKVGREPNVVNPFVRRPFAPSEHATVAKDCVEMSYVWSKETVSALLSPRTSVAQRASEKTRVVNFMMEIFVVEAPVSFKVMGWMSLHY